MTERNEQFLTALSNRILYLCKIHGISPEKVTEEIHSRRSGEISAESLMDIHTDEIYKIAEVLGVEADFLLGRPSSYTAEVEYIVYLLKRKDISMSKHTDI
ncbi:MAG: hypothetical protein HFG34_02010 [Eubacterium sp.]|nr:hypothetical protein [Eubacterium sp.]